MKYIYVQRCTLFVQAIANVLKQKLATVFFVRQFRMVLCFAFEHTYFIVRAHQYLNINADKTKLFVMAWQEKRIYACTFVDFHSHRTPKISSKWKRKHRTTTKRQSIEKNRVSQTVNQIFYCVRTIIDLKC